MAKKHGNDISASIEKLEFSMSLSCEKNPLLVFYKNIRTKKSTCKMQVLLACVVVWGFAGYA